MQYSFDPRGGTAAPFILLIGLSWTGGCAGALAQCLSIALPPGIAIPFPFSEARNRLLAAGFPVYIVIRSGDAPLLGEGEDFLAGFGAREAFRHEAFIIGEFEPTPSSTHAKQPVR
jgi:hypothetical protein